MCNNSEVLTYDWIKTGGRSGMLRMKSNKDARIPPKMTSL